MLGQAIPSPTICPLPSPAAETDNEYCSGEVVVVDSDPVVVGLVVVVDDKVRFGGDAVVVTVVMPVLVVEVEVVVDFGDDVVVIPYRRS